MRPVFFISLYDNDTHFLRLSNNISILIHRHVVIQTGGQRSGFFPSTGEYAKVFGLDKESLKYIKPDALIMHPGPINRDVELASALADGPQSVILEQVTNGLAVRMAVLFLVAGCLK